MYWTCKLITLLLAAPIVMGITKLEMETKHTTKKPFALLLQKHELLQQPSFELVVSKNEILLAGNGSAVLRQKDGGDSVPRIICGVSEGRLAEIARLVQKATIGPPVPKVNRSLCFNIFTNITHLAYSMTARIKLLSEMEKRDDAHILAEHTHIAENLEQFNTMINNLKNITQRSLPLVVKNYYRKLSAFQKQINELVSSKIDMRAVRKAESIKQCIHHLKNGESSLAAVEFGKLNDISVPIVTKIISESYAGNPENIVKIVAFAKLVPLCSTEAVIYSVLFSEMNKSGHLTRPEVLTFLDGTEGVCQNALGSLRAQLLQLGNYVTLAWVNKVRNNDTKEIYKFAILPQYKPTMDKHLPELIMSSYYNNLSHFDAVLNFVHDLPSYLQSLVGYQVLLTEMYKNESQLYSGEIIRFAYKVKETMATRNFAALSADTKDMYNNLKSRLPPNVVGLVWNGNSCSVKNSRHPEYLYAEDDEYNHDNHSRRVFTWVEGSLLWQGRWTFETDDQGNTFQIRNTYFKEYLFASSNSSRDTERRSVFTGTHGETVIQGKWKLAPVNGSAFTIKNTWHDEFLFADGNMDYGYDVDKRRGVFTWKSATLKADLWLEHYWLIKC